MTETLTHDEIQELDRFAIDVALLQGLWTEAQYLRLSAATNRLIEYTDGDIEEVPTPTRRHQAVLSLLNALFLLYLGSRGGAAYFAPLRLRIAGGRYREPDLLVLRAIDDPRGSEHFFTGADLVVEVISPDDPQRDLVTKRDEYASTGIAEYWIVDPRDATILVLVLDGAAYAEHGHFARGSVARSPSLPGFEVPVDAVFDAR